MKDSSKLGTVLNWEKVTIRDSPLIMKKRLKKIYKYSKINNKLKEEKRLKLRCPTSNFQPPTSI